MKAASLPQIQKIHVLLNQLGIADMKREIIFRLTDGRTNSAKELQMEEARQLISNLALNDPSERLKGIIFSMAYKAGLIYGNTEADKKMNAAKLNVFLKERGAVKKALNEMNYGDLVKIHRQFEAIVKHVQVSNDNKQADKAVKNLLDELNFK
jgi:hypothetical protein